MAFGDSMFDPAAASPYAGTAPGGPAGGSTFTDMLNGLSGSMPDITNGIQSLAYGIGSFAKDPRKRAMYIQAAQAHQEHMSADKAAHAKVLSDHVDQILGYYAKANPSVRAALDPYVTHAISAAGALNKDLGVLAQENFNMLKAMPAETSGDPFTLGPGQNRYGADGKLLTQGPAPADDKPLESTRLMGLIADAKAKGDTEAVRRYTNELTKVTEFAPPSQTNVKINMPNQDEYNSRLYGARMQQANEDLESVLASGWKPGMVEKAVSGMPGGNLVVSDNQQLFNQAQDNFINADLRRESGAAISDAEHVNANRQYFPQPGDSAKVLAQKARNRRLAITGIAQAGGRAPALAVPSDGAAPPALPHSVARPGAPAGAPPPIPPGFVPLGQ